MTKVSLSISLDIDDLETLSDVRSKYHQKNFSHAIHTVIKQWQMFIDERQKKLLLSNDSPQKGKKLLNPQVMA